MSSFTCITCRVMFVDGATQRAHYKTDWHRYNLKRKVVDLPAVSAENFKLRVLNAQKPEASGDKTELVCRPCRKHFNSAKALENHVQSKKHKDVELKFKEKNNSESENDQIPTASKALNVKNDVEMETKENKIDDADIDSDVESVDSFSFGKNTDSDVESVDSFGSEDGLGLEECLFCSHIRTSLEENLQHMSVKHGFFVPDAEYVSDLEGLITYLGQKVGEGYMCLWCNEKGKVFRSSKSAQKHMVDKGHCKMLHEGDVLLEYTDFYDYRSSYPDFDPDNVKEGEEDMEVDKPVVELDSEEFELVLPSGSTVGHRALAKYYKQNINPRSWNNTKAVLPKLLAQYKALGWTGTTGRAAERRCKDLGAMQRLKKHHYMGVGVRANKLQHHFRIQNPI